MSITQISRFISEGVPAAQTVTGDGDESATLEGGDGFADYSIVSLYCLDIYLKIHYRTTIDQLTEMPQIMDESTRSTTVRTCL